MYLKRIELLGFKSFASKTVLELDPGMTAIVGPNGSGKSNVVDAVRWALGEQSLRAVRSRKSEEVIFAGNARRSPVGMAEVTLLFDNADRELPLSFAEVSITRRQYRSGEGEYLINRSRVRLKDVVELLTHASLGPDAYAVVGQGSVDEVLLQRPEERRALLETAADISRHQIKLRESLDRLAEMGANLQRVEDIRVEIAPRLARLRAQANRARRHEDLLSRLKTMERCHYLLQLREAHRSARAHLESEGEEGKAVSGAAAARAQAQQELSQLRLRLREEEALLETARERVSSLRLACAQAEREAALAREREAAYRRQLREGEEDLARAREERRELGEEAERLSASRAALVEQESAARAKMAPLEAEWRQASSEERLLQAQLERLLGDQQVAARRRSELHERRSALAREAQRAEQNRTESARAIEESTGRLVTLEEQLSAAQGEIDRLQARSAELEAEQREAQQRLRELGLRVEAARRREREAWEKDNDLRNRLSLLQSLKEEHRGVPPGARTLLNAKLPGIRGTLASMFRAPGEYVGAVAAALGGAQSYVVSEGFSAGLEALQFLDKRPGRATIAPLRLEKREPPRTLAEEFRSHLNGHLEGIAFRGLAAELVSCPPEARELCDRYLGLSLVVEGMADAVELYDRLSGLTDGRLSFQVVTLDGKLLRARGDLASTQSGEKDGSLLAREAELFALSESAGHAQALLKEARAAVSALEASQTELSRAVASASAEVSRLRAETGKRSSAHSELASQLAKVEAALEWHRSRLGAAVRELAHSQTTAEALEKESASASARESMAKDRLSQLRDDLAAQQSVLAEVSSRRSRLQSEALTVQNRLREVEARAAAQAETIQRTDLRLRRQEERVTQSSEALEQWGRSSQETSPPALEGELESAEQGASGLSARVQRSRDQVAAGETLLAAASKELDLARERLAEARSRAQRSTVELEVLLREAARELDLEGDPVGAGVPAGPTSSSMEGDPVGAGVPAGPTQPGNGYASRDGQGEDGQGGHPGRLLQAHSGDGASPILPAPPGRGAEQGRLGPALLETTARTMVEALEVSLADTPAKGLPETVEVASDRVRALRRELQALGTINAEAPEEYRVAMERHAFLTAQLEDLREAERTLRKAVEDLKSAMEVRFRETFELVNAEFSRSFSTLFGGGSATLALTRPEQPLEGGIDVVAAPPGRRTGPLLALSGGERALTAVALLFALMKVNPSPFCVLDEVDAALDESNVARFCQMVRHLTDRTQFLLITHNRTTMEMASALYGVSMATDLTSKVVSLKLT